MGHSFCSGPSLPDGLREEFATPSVNIKRIPRSPGFTAERRLPTDDLADIRNLHAIKDLLQKDPSTLIRTDSKRRKPIAALFTKPGYLSSKQVKQMLLSRRSISPRPSATSSHRPLTKDVAPRVTKDGKKYLQIATSSDMYECGNPSVYQVNHRQIVSGTDPPLASLDNIDPYYLGITEEYPHLIISHEEGRRPNSVDEHRRNKSSLPTNPVENAGSAFEKGSLAPDHLPKSNDVGGVAERQYSPVSKARIYGPKPIRSPVRTAAVNAQSRPLSPDIRPPAPLALPSQSKYQPPRTPRNSVEEPLKGSQASPTPRTYSKPPSIQSITNSFADDAQSECSDGVISMAQSAEVVRAGYYSSGAHKFPKPGPAPTGALPSLPEGLDSKTNIVYLPSVGKNAGTPVKSPSPKAIQRSPGKRNRYRPLDDAVNEDTARLLRAQTRSKPKHASQLPTAGLSHKPSADEPCEKALTPDDTAGTQEKSWESWREIRAQSRKALKLRDLNRLRIQDDNDNSPVDANAPATAGAENKDMQSSGARMRESCSSPALLPGYQPKFRQTKASNESARSSESKSRPISQISPVLVLAEQEPMYLPFLDGKAADIRSHGRNLHFSEAQKKPSTYLPSPALPSLPSSDEDTTNHRTTLPTDTHTTSTTRAIRSGANPDNHRALPHPFTNPSEVSDLEARLSTRITELEKKNTMLLNAFIAVINTSAGFAGGELLSHGSSGDHRSSEMSGGSGSGLRSSGAGTSGGYRSSGGELERVVEGDGGTNSTGNENGDRDGGC